MQQQGNTKNSRSVHQLECRLWVHAADITQTLWSWEAEPRPCSCSLQSSMTLSHKYITIHCNWRAPWKNRINSTSMKLRKSLVKTVTRQNISSCSVLSLEIVMHDAFNVILWTSIDICVVEHDDLGWKNQTTRYILPCHWLYEWFSSGANVRRCASRMVILGEKLNNTL